jgi:hypothetical protein
VSIQIEERLLLEELCEAGERFRNTPIVDDDFCAMRDTFDLLLAKSVSFLKENKALSVFRGTVIVDGCMGQQECSQYRVTNPRPSWEK